MRAFVLLAALAAWVTTCDGLAQTNDAPPAATPTQPPPALPPPPQPYPYPHPYPYAQPYPYAPQPYPPGYAPYPMPPAPPPPAPEDEPGYKTHDGVYTRLGIGAGSMSFDSDVAVEGVGEGALSGSKFAIALEFAVGGTPAPGFVIGGGIFMLAMGGTLQLEAEGQASDANVDPGAFSIIGLFVDWYVNPKEGLHVQAAAGWARFSINDPAMASNSPTLAPLMGGPLELDGIGVLLGAGYEFWASAQWSLGPLLRIMVADLGGSLGNASFDARVITPNLLFTATGH